MGFFEVYLEKKPHQFCKFTCLYKLSKIPRVSHLPALSKGSGPILDAAR